MTEEIVENVDFDVVRKRMKKIIDIDTVICSNSYKRLKRSIDKN